MTWITDERGNRASVERWGSELLAREALESCSDCSDCSDCSRCSGCSRCSDCSDMAPQKTACAVPVIHDIHRKLLDAVTADGCRLKVSDWHSCETAHCRAGWVVHLAGDAGYALEKQTSALFAAQQIYKASGYQISPCRFFDDGEKAMADIRRCAELQPTESNP